MNFLDICKKVDIMSGVQGMIQSVESTVGAQEVIVNATQQGFVELQEERMTWEFMRRTREWPLAVGKYQYSIVDIFGPPATLDPLAAYTTFGRWQKKKPLLSYQIQDPDNGKWTQVVFVDYREFRFHLKNNLGDTGKPRYVTADEVSNDLLFSPTPDKAYVVHADYFVEPQILVANVQTPILPSRFHQLIIYRGLERVGAFYGNPGLQQRYAVADAKMTGNLYRDQNPAETVRIRSVA